MPHGSGSGMNVPNGARPLLTMPRPASPPSPDSRSLVLPAWHPADHGAADRYRRLAHHAAPGAGRLLARPCGPPGSAALVPPPGVGAWARHAAGDAGALCPAAAGTPHPLVSAASLHLRGRQGLGPRRGRAVWPVASPPHGPPRQVFWGGGAVRPAAPAHALHGWSPARGRPATRPPVRRRGGHDHTDQPHGGVGWRPRARGRGRHGRGALGLRRGRPCGSPWGLRP
jgi:hypothetical protein